MAPPRSQNNNPNVPVIPKLQTGISAVDTWLIRIIDILNPVLRLGTTMLQGRPLPAPTAANDGQVPTYDAAADIFVYGTAGGDAPLASSTVIGIAKLSLDPVDPLEPIAVGNNDPRNSNARTPTGPAGGGLGGTYPNPTINFPAPVPTVSTYNVSDDFEGYQLNLRWNPETVGTGSVGPTRIGTIVPGNNGDNACGNIDCFVPAAADGAGIDWGGAPGYLNWASNPFEGYIEWAAMFIASTPVATGTYSYRVGFGESIATLLAGTGQSITLGQDATGGFAAYINLGAGEHKFPTVNAIPFFSPLIVFRIVFPAYTGGSLPYPKFFVNGTDTGIDVSTLGTFPQGSTLFLQPLAEILAITIPGGVTGPHMYLDYFVISRTRPTMTG